MVCFCIGFVYFGKGVGFAGFALFGFGKGLRFALVLIEDEDHPFCIGLLGFGPFS